MIHLFASVSKQFTRSGGIEALNTKLYVYIEALTTSTSPKTSVDSVPNFYFYSHSRSVPNIFFTSISIPIPFLNCFYFYSRSVPKSILISIPVPVPRIGTEIAILTFIPILGTN